MSRTPLVGRADELAVMVELLGGGARLVTVTGAGGSGKTRLAVEAARQVGPQLAGGALFVELAPFRQAEDIPLAVAAAIDPRRVHQPAPGRRASQALGELPMLLVLDNLEHLSGAHAYVAELVDGCPDLTVLATSVAPLRIRGEQVVRLDPLPVPPVESSDPALLLTQPCVDLFRQRAVAADARFELTAANVEAVADVCRLLDGLPLAIELAAARVAVMPPEALREQLLTSSPLDLLGRGPADAPVRHRSLRQSIDWSYRLLGGHERRLLARLSVFQSSFSLDALQAVCADPDDGPGDVLDEVSSLVDARLVEPDPRILLEPRFVLPPLVRRFASEQLDASGDAVELRARHTRYFRALARWAATAFERGDEVAALARLALEENELRSVLIHLSEERKVAAGLQLAADVAPLTLQRGFDSVTGRRLDRLLELVPDDALDDATLARALVWSGGLALGQLDVVDRADTAAQRLDDGLRLARANDQRELVLRGLSFVVLALPATGGVASAAAAAAEGLERAEAASDLRWLARFEAWSGMLAHQGGDRVAAADLGARALVHARQAEDPRAVVLAALLLSPLPPELFDVPGGLPPLEELRSTCRQIGDIQAESYVLAAMAAREVARGDAAAAARLCLERLSLVRGLGWHGTGLGFSVMNLVGVAVQRGELERAARLHGSLGRAYPVLRAAVAPAQGAAYDERIDVIRKRLGRTDFERARRAGAALTEEQAAAEAVAYAQALVAEGDAARPPAMTDPTTISPGLTAREVDVLKRMATGDSNKEIGRSLGLSTKTVMHHSMAIYRKLGVRGRAEATAWAVRHDVVADDARGPGRP